MEEVVGKGARFIGFGRTDNCRGEFQELEREALFRGRCEIEREGRKCRGINLRFIEKRTDAGVGVLEVGSGIAFEGEGLIPIEVDGRGRVVRKVGILDGAEADLFGESFIATAFLDDFEGAALGFGEEFFEADEVAFAR